MKHRKDTQRITNDYTEKSKFTVDVLKTISSMVTKETPSGAMNLRRQRFGFDQIKWKLQENLIKLKERKSQENISDWHYKYLLTEEERAYTRLGQFQNDDVLHTKVYQ